MKRRHSLIVTVLLLTALLAACTTSSDLTATGATTAGSTDAAPQSSSVPSPDGASATAAEDPPQGSPESSPGGFSAQSLRAIAEQSLDGTSGRAEMVMTMDASGLPELPGGLTMSFLISAEWDAAGNERVVMDMSDMLNAILGASGEEIPAELAEMFDAFNSPIEMRVVDGRVYMSSAFFNSFLLFLGESIPTPWMSLDGDVFGPDAAAEMIGSNPEMAREFLQLLRGAGEVTELGTEVIRGATTTHLRVEVSLAGLLEAAADDAEAAELEELWAELGSAGDLGIDIGDIPLTLEVWVEDPGVVHRIAMRLDAADMAAAMGETVPAGSSLVITMTTDLFDFGADIVITAPPADQVTDATELFERLATMGF